MTNTLLIFLILLTQGVFASDCEKELEQVINKSIKGKLTCLEDNGVVHLFLENKNILSYKALEKEKLKKEAWDTVIFEKSFKEVKIKSAFFKDLNEDGYKDIVIILDGQKSQILLSYNLKKDSPKVYFGENFIGIDGKTKEKDLKRELHLPKKAEINLKKGNLVEVKIDSIVFNYKYQVLSDDH